jgi:hypothetical protein
MVSLLGRIGVFSGIGSREYVKSNGRGMQPLFREKRALKIGN